jgi:hypothetical protein
MTAQGRFYQPIGFREYIVSEKVSFPVILGGDFLLTFWGNLL